MKRKNQMGEFTLTKRQKIGGMLNAAERELANVKAQPDPDQNAIRISERDVQRWREELERLPKECKRAFLAVLTKSGLCVG
jgi:DNA-directed RNA polymerase specialized sigma24 family protein